MTRSFVAAIVLVAAGSTAFAADHTFERSLSTGSAPSVSVATGSGYIHLRAGADNQVHISGHVHSGNNGWFSGGDVESRIQQIVANPPIHQNGDQITIGERHAGDLYRNLGIDYEVTVPRGSKLDASTGSGDIEAQDVGSTIKADSGSGSVRVRGAHGAANLQTGSGDVELNEAGEGEILAQTGSGSIRLRDIHGGLRAQTGSGDIEASGQITSDSKLDTGSGSVRLDLGPQARLNLNASTGSGSIRTQQNISMQGDLNRHHVIGSINGGGPSVRINTGSGDIEIR